MQTCVIEQWICKVSAGNYYVTFARITAQSSLKHDPTFFNLNGSNNNLASFYFLPACLYEKCKIEIWIMIDHAL